MTDIALTHLIGRSLPSKKYGAWIVAEVRGDIYTGRSRLVTGDLKGEQWVWTYDLVQLFEEIDAIDLSQQEQPSE